MELEFGNIRKALRYFQEIGDGSRLIRLVTAIDEYMGAHPLDREALNWLEIGFSLNPNVDDTTAVIARTYASAAAGRVGMMDRARWHCELAIGLAEESDSAYLRGRAYFAMGAFYEHHVDAASSLAWYERAADALRLTGADSYFAMSLAECADKLHWLGELESSDKLGGEALALMRVTDDRWALSMLLGARSRSACCIHGTFWSGDCHGARGAGHCIEPGRCANRAWGGREYWQNCCSHGSGLRWGRSARCNAEPHAARARNCELSSILPISDTGPCAIAPGARHHRRVSEARCHTHI